MNFKLTNTDRDALRKFQRNVSDRSSYVKVTTLILLDKGLEISDYLGIDDSTRYGSSFQKDSLALYLEIDYQATGVSYHHHRLLNYDKNSKPIFALTVNKLPNGSRPVGKLLILHQVWLIYLIVSASLTNKLNAFLVKRMLKSNILLLNNSIR